MASFGWSSVCQISDSHVLIVLEIFADFYVDRNLIDSMSGKSNIKYSVFSGTII